MLITASVMLAIQIFLAIHTVAHMGKKLNLLRTRSEMHSALLDRSSRAFQRFIHQPRGQNDKMQTVNIPVYYPACAWETPCLGGSIHRQFYQHACSRLVGTKGSCIMALADEFTDVASYVHVDHQRQDVVSFDGSDFDLVNLTIYATMIDDDSAFDDIVQCVLDRHISNVSKLLITMNDSVDVSNVYRETGVVVPLYALLDTAQGCIKVGPHGSNVNCDQDGNDDDSSSTCSLASPASYTPSDGHSYHNCSHSDQLAYPPCEIAYPPCEMAYPPCEMAYPPCDMAYPPCEMAYPPCEMAYPYCVMGYPVGMAPPQEVC